MTIKSLLLPADWRVLGVGLAVAASFSAGVGLMQWRYSDEIEYGEKRLAFAMSCAVALDTLGLTERQE